jgi:hypothetical protein
MKLKILYEAGHWEVLPKHSKGKMSFLVGGTKDRNRFIKKMFPGKKGKR